MPHSFPTRRCADLAVGDLPRRERRALPAPPLSARSEVIEVELAAWPPSSGIGNPAVDVGFMPPCAVGADFELGRERAFGDLAIDGGPGQAGAGRSEEHTSELQSLMRISYAVFCLKKKKNT